MAMMRSRDGIVGALGCTGTLSAFDMVIGRGARLRTTGPRSLTHRRTQHAMRQKFVMLGLLAALLLAVAAPSGARRTSAAAPAAPVATTAQTHAAILDKTRFLAHAGIAFFIIHHEYRRYQHG